MLDKNTFNQDLVSALSSLPALHFDATNPHFRSEYLSLSGLLNGIRPTLAKHNLAVSQDIRIDSAAKELCVRTALLHISGQKLESSEARFPIPQFTPQGIGSVQTYAKRYQLLSLLGISGDKDDDAETVEAPTRKAAAKKNVPPNDMVPF
jgi:hypothetical protein